MTDIADKINQFAVEFDQKSYQRHVDGEEKYGPGTWLTIDTLQHAMDEVLDLGNYAKFTYIKLRLLQEQLAQFQADASTAQAKPGYDGPLSKLHTGGVPE